MFCFKYDKTTGEFRGKHKRQLDPKERRYLMPVHSTLSEPPKYDPKKETPFFKNGKWINVLRDDYVRNTLRETNKVGAKTKIFKNGKIIDRTDVDIRKDEAKIKLENSKNEARQLLYEYHAKLIKKILAKTKMNDELSYIKSLESIAENGVSDIDNPDFPIEP